MNMAQSSDVFSNVFHSAPVSFAICTLGEGRFLEVNEGFSKLVGFTREELVGRTDLELGIWAEPQARDQWWQKLAERQPVRDVDCRIRTKSGELRQALASAELIRDQHQTCVLFITHDITERLNQEVQICQSQKMEVVSQLAAGFAHDFNNILAIVQGYTSLVLSEPGLDPRSSKALQQVAIAAERAANLTRQLLTISRKQIMQPKTMDLSNVIQGLTNLMQRLLNQGISLKYNFSTGVPLVKADMRMIEHLIVNLAVNARDAMPNGGQLTITTSAAVIDNHYVRLKPEARVGQYACLTVSDTGCGMNPATLNRIFEPFFTTKGVGKGAGLGLATVYGITKQHNGWIEVASQPGQGTMFKIFLPAEAKAADPSSGENRQPSVTGGKERIFVVEDEPGLRALVQGILEKYGYDVVTAANGLEALEVWNKQAKEIDLLLTDMVMPEGMSGRELAEKLRDRQPRLKVIYTSGYSVDLMGENADDLVEGINFLQKPYRPQGLAQTVRDCLDGRRSRGNMATQKTMP